MNGILSTSIEEYEETAGIRFPRDTWERIKCTECGKINETYWDGQGFPSRTIRRCLCKIKVPAAVKTGGEL